MTNGLSNASRFRYLGPVIAAFAIASPAAEPSTKVNWNSQAAAAYLDARETWWMGWSTAARDHETFCVSCHTVLPYALARSALRTTLRESALSSTERRLVDNVSKRVTLWKEVEPFYSDEKVGPFKTVQSRGTEAVLNALVLATYADQISSSQDLLRQSFRNLWELQQKSGGARGSWFWLNFGNQPWEAEDSQFYGAALAAVAVGTAPDEYRNSPEIQSNLQILTEYLRRNYPSASQFNRAVLLWASGRLPALLPASDRVAIVKGLVALQQNDGGWTLSSLVVKDWKRRDGTPLEARSDGYATGLVALALQQSGFITNSSELGKARAWLLSNQNKEGFWPAYSLNAQRNSTSDAAYFMNDAATAYAVLALTQPQP